MFQPTPPAPALQRLGKPNLVFRPHKQPHGYPLLAPFSGTVTAVSANVGDTVGNSAVVTIADMSKLYLETYVDETDYALFKVGNSATVVFDALPDQTRREK